MKKTTTLLTVCGILAAQTAFAGSNANEHAPIGVMGDHNHLTGEWMIGYRFNQMSMKNPLLDNGGDIFGSAMMAPKAMKKQMQMLGLMYGVTDKLTMVVSTSYVKTTMDMAMKSGMEFSTEASGIGDSKIGGLYSLYQGEGSKLLANLALVLPTGSIQQTDNTPMTTNQRLAPNMQPGSGTYDIGSKLTYTYSNEEWAMGAQANALVRTGQNDNGYRLGNKIGFSAWVAKNLTHYLSLSARLDASKWGDINADLTVNPALAMTNLRGGERIDLLGGINFIVPEGPLKGNRLAVEFGKPIYQEVNGAQTENDYRFTVGWQLAF